MKQSMISICYYPTTVVLIDDKEKYLTRLKSDLKSERLSCLTYNNPQKALDFLTKQYQANPFIQRCLVNQDDYVIDRIATNFDVRAVYREIYNAQRVNEISTLVIDYAMPGMSGLELCRQLRERRVPFKIIMLTGEAGKDLAVEAFNEGVIDKFIMKNTDNLMDVLVNSIHELQQSYFLGLSTKVLSVIDASANQMLVCLNDPVFVEFFQDLCKKHRAVEYYLLDDQGSFLLFDIEANPTWLLLNTKDEIESAYDLAKHGDNVPRNVLDALQNKQKIVYLHTDEELNTSPADWLQYMHPVKELKGSQQTYYYAIVTDPNIYSLNQKEILSYKSYLKTI